MQTYYKAVYERYAIWARAERNLAETLRSAGDDSGATHYTERANDFARQATEAMQALATMR